MEVNEFLELIPDYVLGQLSEEKESAFLACLLANPVLQNEIDSWSNLKGELAGITEEPSKKMDDVFYEFLKQEASKDTYEDQGGGSTKVFSLLGNKFFAPLIAASIMLMFGLFLGKQWGSNSVADSEDSITATELQNTKQETENVRTQLVISLADEPSAAQRLEAISESKKLETATDKVVEALFKMLNTDPNVNVRMAAVTSLSRYVNNPKVREGLVMSIINQDSPHVQIALAELMVELKEKESIQSIEELLQKPSTNEVVKEKLRESINQII